MGDLQTFGPMMLEKFLHATQLNYTTDDEGDYVVQFEPTPYRNFVIRIYLLREGDNSQIYVIRGVANQTFSTDQRQQAIAVCNEWNSGRRWPKAFLFVPPASNDAATLVLEQQIDMTYGMQQEGLDAFSNAIITGTLQFWEWVQAFSKFNPIVEAKVAQADVARYPPQNC